MPDETPRIMTPDEVAEVKALVDRATPGPWEHRSTSVFADLEPGRSLYKVAHAYEAGTAETFRAGKGNCVDNAEFIAAARTAIPRLIATVEASWEERDRLLNVERDERTQGATT